MVDTYHVSTKVSAMTASCSSGGQGSDKITHKCMYMISQYYPHRSNEHCLDVCVLSVSKRRSYNGQYFIQTVYENCRIEQLKG